MSAGVSLGLMIWLAWTTVCSSTRISQLRLAVYGHWMEIRIPASAASVSTPVASNVRPGNIVGLALLTWTSLIR